MIEMDELLYLYADEAFHEFLSHVSIERWLRLKDSITWSESLEGDVYYFEAQVLQVTASYILIGVSVDILDYVNPPQHGTVGLGAHFEIQR